MYWHVYSTCEDGECVGPAPEAATSVELRDENEESHKGIKEEHENLYKSLRDIFSASGSLDSDHKTLLSEIEAAEFFGGCTIDFQIWISFIIYVHCHKVYPIKL